MAEFQYVTVPNKLAAFLEEIKSVGIPETASMGWLKEIGFTSSSHQSFPKVLQSIGFVDSSRKPTEKWRQFRDKSQSGKVIAAAIEEGYSKLYQVYPDAHLRSDDELVNFFRSHTEAGDQTVRRTANTFKALCSLADFGQTQEGVAYSESPSAPLPVQEQPPQTQLDSRAPAPAPNIDIKINISSDSSPEQIKQIFESMAKHLYKRNVEEPMPY
ncbi:MAG: DUF5343 domain-containing protein [Halieaceae bacterium]|nr:DUF5343 domain-containing protein [Halieaceae bacterium]